MFNVVIMGFIGCHKVRLNSFKSAIAALLLFPLGQIAIFLSRLFFDDLAPTAHDREVHALPLLFTAPPKRIDAECSGICGVPLPPAIEQFFHFLFVNILMVNCQCISHTHRKRDIVSVYA